MWKCTKTTRSHWSTLTPLTAPTTTTTTTKSECIWGKARSNLTWLEATEILNQSNRHDSTSFISVFFSSECCFYPVLDEPPAGEESRNDRHAISCLFALQTLTFFLLSQQISQRKQGESWSSAVWILHSFAHKPHKECPLSLFILSFSAAL